MFAAVHESGYDPSKFHVISCLITTRLDWIHGVLGFGSLGFLLGFLLGLPLGERA